jgi:hypothetical protein
VSLGLNNSYVEFRFDVGSGPAVIRSDHPIRIGDWHTVKLSRTRKQGNVPVRMKKLSCSLYFLCGILPHGGGLVSNDRASAHALNSGNTGLGGIKLTTSQAPVTPSPRMKLRASGTIASVA